MLSVIPFPVYLESDNLYSALGTETHQVFEKLISGIAFTNSLLLPYSGVRIPASLIDRNKLQEDFYRMFPAAMECTPFEKIVFLSLQKALTNSKINADDPKTGWIFASAKYDIEAFIEALTENSGEDSVVGAQIIRKIVHKIRSFFRFQREPILLSNACISGTLAVVMAQKLLQYTELEAVVIIAADLLHHFVLSGFESLKAISISGAQPFDLNRDGFTPGEAAATLILTSTPLPNKIPIRLMGGSMENDLTTLTAPDLHGTGLQKAVQNALKAAESRESEIDFFMAHGTATIKNDAAESHALQSLAPNARITGIKGSTGHTFGACGLTELIIAAEALRRNQLLPTYGCLEPMLPGVQIQCESRELKLCVKTSLGFGGGNAAVVLKKE